MVGGGGGEGGEREKDKGEREEREFGIRWMREWRKGDERMEKEERWSIAGTNKDSPCQRKNQRERNTGHKQC